MCGRTLISESKTLASKAGVTVGSGYTDTNRPPGTDMPVILDARPGKLNYIKWGLLPHYLQEAPKFSLTYTRLETIASMPHSRELLGRRHCVFVVEGFYEFDKKQTPSQPYFFERKDKGVMLLAGLWDTWKDLKTGVVIPSCTMIMQPANAYLGKIHDRMPCILSQGEADLWLNREATKAARMAVLKPVSNELLMGCQVDSKMNNARNKDLDNNRPNNSQTDLFKFN